MSTTSQLHGKNSTLHTIQKTNTYTFAEYRWIFLWICRETEMSLQIGANRDDLVSYFKMPTLPIDPFNKWNLTNNNNNSNNNYVYTYVYM